METQTLIDELRAEKAKLPLADFTKKEIVLENLGLMARIIVASEHLLEVAIGEVCRRGGKFERKLLDYFREHLLEERNHFEWLMQDLVNANYVVDAYCPKVAELVGAQYYLIHHIHPAALLGYMLVLEHDPVPLETVVALEDLHGKPLFRTLRLHAEEDQEHAKDLLGMLEKVPDNFSNLVRENALNTVKNLGRIYAELMKNGQ